MDLSLLNWVDWLIIVVIVLSVLMSLWRGLIKEVMSLIIWSAAFIVAMLFSDQLSFYLQDIFSNSTVRYGLSFILLFFLTFVSGILLSFFLTQLVAIGGLSAVDRILGGVFGFLRGMLMITITVLLLSMTSIVTQNFWIESQLIPTFTGLAQSIVSWVPAEISGYFNFDLDSKAISEVYTQSTAKLSPSPTR